MHALTSTFPPLYASARQPDLAMSSSSSLIPTSLRINDHRQISRIVAGLWNGLPPDERKVFEEKAKQAKLEHERRYPNYTYKPILARAADAPVKKRRKKKGAEEEEDEDTGLKEKRRCNVVVKILLDTPGTLTGNAAPLGSDEGEELKQKIGVEMRRVSLAR